ncbi:hypothetical protein Tco_0974847 [Tanacetum coccineum]|uniref:Uncharacterized protein n=1 Tax=Tanacetum coccineum TaxID=301880 RepID=A0ABQ5ECR8_9ASTR
MISILVTPRVSALAGCDNEHLGCAGKEAGLVEKLVVVEKEKDNLLDKNRDNEYKRSLSDVFNQDIAAGWSEGLKIERIQEEAEAILATATDYDPLLNNRS